MAVSEKIINKIIGYILISPGLISVGRYYLLVYNKTVISQTEGDPIPIYLGLMAIAGVYLIKDKN